MNVLNSYKVWKKQKKRVAAKKTATRFFCLSLDRSIR